MWFCVPCRERVENDIVMDLKIEKKCKEIMSPLESRISKLEVEITNKCDENKVKEIVTKEIDTIKK